MGERALKKAGVNDVVFLELPAVKAKNRTSATLEKKWATKENTAKVASQIRQHKDDRVLYYAGEAEDLKFLSGFADKCAGAANDPSCRKKKQQDEYLHEVKRLIDGTSNEERAASPADTSWRTLSMTTAAWSPRKTGAGTGKEKASGRERSCPWT